MRFHKEFDVFGPEATVICVLLFGGMGTGFLGNVLNIEALQYGGVVAMALALILCLIAAARDPDIFVGSDEDEGD